MRGMLLELSSSVVYVNIAAVCICGLLFGYMYVYETLMLLWAMNHVCLFICMAMDVR